MVMAPFNPAFILLPTSPTSPLANCRWLPRQENANQDSWPGLRSAYPSGSVHSWAES